MGYINPCDLFKVEGEVQSCLKVLHKTGEDGVQWMPGAVQKPGARKELVNQPDTLKVYGRLVDHLPVCLMVSWQRG